MKNPVKEFFHRGLVFGGFGPIITAIIYLIVYFTEKFTLSGLEIFTAIISTYILAFVHAGVSVFNQMEEWPIMKSVLCHFSVLYVTYTVCYLINSWIPFDLKVFLIYTACFVVVYIIIWLIVVTSLKISGQKINRKLG